MLDRLGAASSCRNPFLPAELTVQVRDPCAQALHILSGSRVEVEEAPV